MSDRLSPDDYGQERGSGPHPDAEANLQSLRARLDELQHSVENLGTQAGWEAQPSPGPPLDMGPGHFTQPPVAPGPPPDYGAPPPAYGAGYAPPPPRFQTPAEAPAADPYAPAPPAATNGHGDSEGDSSEVSARWATVAIVEAGPFADLIELRHFEDDLAALAAVSDVRVRRFGHGRATIEVGMTGPYPLARELFQLNRPMELSDGPEGEVLIDLAPTVTETGTGREAQPEPPTESPGETG